MNEIANNPLLVVLIGAIPGFALGLIAYRRSVKVDKATETTMIAATQTAAIGQVITGLNQLVDTLQADNRELREMASECGDKLRAVMDERDVFKAELHELKRLIASSAKEIQENVEHP